jgi:hypothetical protein
LSIKGLEPGPGPVFLYPNSEETGLNCNEPVYIGFLRFFPVTRPVLTGFITLFTLLYIYTYYECEWRERGYPLPGDETSANEERGGVAPPSLVAKRVWTREEGLPSSLVMKVNKREQGGRCCPPPWWWNECEREGRRGCLPPGDETSVDKEGGGVLVTKQVWTRREEGSWWRNKRGKGARRGYPPPWWRNERGRGGVTPLPGDETSMDEEGGGVLVMKQAWTRREEGSWWWNKHGRGGRRGYPPPWWQNERGWGGRREEGGWATTSLVKKRVQTRDLLPGEEMSRNDYLLPGDEMTGNEEGGRVPLVKKQVWTSANGWWNECKRRGRGYPLVTKPMRTRRKEGLLSSLVTKLITSK